MNGLCNRYVILIIVANRTRVSILFNAKWYRIIKRRKVVIAVIAKGKHLAKQALALQVVITLVISITSLFLCSFPVMLNYAAGAFSCILPNLAFTHYAYRYSGATKAQKIMRSMSQGSQLKLALTIILMVMAFKYLPPAPAALLVGLAVTTVTYTASVMWLSSRKDSF